MDIVVEKIKNVWYNFTHFYFRVYGLICIKIVFYSNYFWQHLKVLLFTNSIITWDTILI